MANVPQIRTFAALSAPPTGYPKYQLLDGSGAIVTDWTNAGVLGQTDSSAMAALSYKVLLSLDSAKWYTIRWDVHDGTTYDETFGGAVPAQAGDAMALTTDERDSLAGSFFNSVTEGSTTFVQAFRGICAAVMGKVNGLQIGGTPKFRDLADTKDRISAVVDLNGNRLFVTRNLD